MNSCNHKIDQEAGENQGGQYFFLCKKTKLIKLMTHPNTMISSIYAKQSEISSPIVANFGTQHLWHHFSPDAKHNRVWIVDICSTFNKSASASFAPFEEFLFP